MSETELTLYPVGTAITAIIFLILTLLCLFFIFKNKNLSNILKTAITILASVFGILFLTQFLAVFFAIKAKIDLGISNNSTAKNYTKPVSDFKLSGTLSIIPSDKFVSYRMVTILLEAYPKPFDEGIRELIKYYRLADKYAGNWEQRTRQGAYLDYSRLYLFTGEYDSAIEVAKEHNAFPIAAFAYILKGDKLKLKGGNPNEVWENYSKALTTIRNSNSMRFKDLIVVFNKLGQSDVARQLYENEREYLTNSFKEGTIDKNQFKSEIKTIDLKYKEYENYYQKVYSKENYEKLSECTKMITDGNNEKSIVCMNDVLWP